MKRMLPIALFAICWFSTPLALHAQSAPSDNPVSGVILPTPALPSAAILGQWSSGTNIPIPKKYHACASYNGEIYIFAGYTTGNAASTKSYKYTPATDTWTPIADFPIARYLYGLAQTINGKIYITGGLDGTSTAYKALQDCYEYDPVANTYTKKKSMPSLQGFAGSAVLENKMYLISGVGSTLTSFQTLVQVYDPATDTWSTATAYPRPVRYVGATTVGNQIIATGGYNNTFTPSYYIADTYVGSLTNGVLSWKKVADYPIGPTIYITAVSLGNIGYFIGGRPSIDNNAPSTQRSFSYDPAKDAWTTLELKPTGMEALPQGGTDGNKIFIPGGETGDASYSPTAVLDILDPNQAGSAVATLLTPIIDKWVKKTTPGAASVGISNTGTADLKWTAEVDANAKTWLLPTMTSGSITSFSSGTLDLSLNATTLAIGDYSGVITITTNDQSHPTLTVNVTMHVQNEDVDTDLRVYVEEFTGTWCGWCPYGVDSLHALVQQFGDQIAIVSMHNSDAMSKKASDSVITFLSVPGFPSAAINRTLWPGATGVAIYRDVWGNTVRYALDTKRSPVTVSIKNKTYNKSTKQLAFDVTLFAHQTVAGPVSMSIIQTEDSLNYEQHIYNQPYTTVYPFYHENVFKQIIPKAGGMLLTGINIPTQSTLTNHFTFPSADSIAANSHLVVLVHAGSGNTLGAILQSYKEALLDNALAADQPASPSGCALLQNFPNPFNPGTVVAYDVPSRMAVTVLVTDVFGRTVRTLINGTVEAGRHTAQFDGASLPSGQYFVTMRAGGFAQTRAMTLMK